MASLDTFGDMTFTTGEAHLIATLIVVILLLRPRIKTFKTRYGPHIGNLLFLNGIIQCLMTIIMMINAYYEDFSHRFVFEGLALCQQGTYYVIILFIGGVYNQQLYDKNIINIRRLIVCFH